VSLRGRLVTGAVGLLLGTIVAVAVVADIPFGDVLAPTVIALVAGTGLAALAARTIGARLHELAQAARAIAAGTPPRYPHRGIAEVDAVSASLRDMHEQLGARFDVLRRRHSESGTLVNAMVEGVISCDARGRIVTANPAARRLLGYQEGPDLPALPVLFHEKAAREVVNASLRGETVEDREIDLDGRICLLSGRGLPEGGAVLVLHDMTQVRRLEVIRRDFVANVSHELKTPLTSISGYAETLLADTPDADTTRRFLETILTNARRMQRLVDDQLDLSKIESGRWRPAPQEVKTEAALRESWEAVTRPSPADHEFSTEIGRGAESVYADPDALRQVLGNLFDNSRRYTSPGGHVRAAARVENGGVTVSVSDTGAGIPGEHLPRIFERFYRADVSRSRAGGGTGLGLAIVKHTVEAHGGRVWAESALGQGTTIHCWFPSPKETVTRP
jgi:two-component system, OmpR family, phosphate regulon sensor histidine kinase PhoR